MKRPHHRSPRWRWVVGASFEFPPEAVSAFAYLHVLICQVVATIRSPPQPPYRCRHRHRRASATSPQPLPAALLLPPHAQPSPPRARGCPKPPSTETLARAFASVSTRAQPSLALECPTLPSAASCQVCYPLHACGAGFAPPSARKIKQSHHIVPQRTHTIT
jgi:hypothetical protein